MANRFIGFLFLLLLVLGLNWSCSGYAASPEDVRDRIETSIERASETGKKTANWQIERQQLIEEIQHLQLQLAWTGFQLERAERWLETEQGHVQTLSENIERTEVTRNRLAPWLEILYSDLEEHVLSDLPFLTEERRNRLTHLRSVLDTPDSTLSHKLGRLLEAMQVEADYGYSVEVQDRLVRNNSGNIVQAEFFRLGRLSLFRLLTGSRELERFDRDREVWLPLGEQSVYEVEKAMEIARKKRVSSLVYLPIGLLKNIEGTRLPQEQSGTEEQ